MKINCKYDELVDPKILKNYARNRNRHTAEQITRLAKLLEYQGQRAPIIISNLSKQIVKGHGTRDAILMNGWEKCAVVYQDFDNEDQEYAFVQSDNAIAEWSTLDLSAINLDLPSLGLTNIDLLGLKDFKVDVSELLEKEEKKCPHCGEIL